MFKLLEIIFVFLARIYIFFYKDKGEYWRMFPCIIMSSVFMINLQMIISFFFSISKIFIVGLFTVILFFFKKIFDKKEYDWVVGYSLSKKQKIIVVSFLIVDVVIVTILSMISRDIYIAAHSIAR